MIRNQLQSWYCLFYGIISGDGTLMSTFLCLPPLVKLMTQITRNQLQSWNHLGTFPWFHLWRWYLELDVIICIVEMRTWKSRYHFQRWYLDSHFLISTSISGTDDANSTRNQLQSWYHLFHGSISRE